MFLRVHSNYRQPCAQFEHLFAGDVSDFLHSKINSRMGAAELFRPNVTKQI